MTNRYSLTDLALQHVSLDSEAIVAVTPNGHVTRAGFIRRVDDWQHFFSQLPGEKYALYIADAIEFAAALWGAWHAEKIIVLPGDILPSTLQQVACMVDGSVGDMPMALSAPEINSSLLPMFRFGLNQENTKLVILTSGSTGNPSAIDKTLYQLQTEVSALQSCFDKKLGDAIIYGTVSHQHIYGLLFRVLWPLMSCRVMYTQRLEYPEQMVELLSVQSSVLIASPAHLKRLPENLDWQQTASRLRAVFSSGGPLSAESSDKVKQLWRCRPIEVFGSSETGGIAWRQSEDGSTSWQPLPNVQWKIINEHLHVRSPHLAGEHWFITQDRAAFLDNNKFELLGRSDRIIKLEERRISLTAIEKELLSSCWIHDCKLVVLPGQRERLAVVAVLSETGMEALQLEGKLALVNLLRESLKTSVDPIAIPRHWRFIEAMPVDKQGKTSHRLLVELFRISIPAVMQLQHSSESAILMLDINKDLIIFDGHFSQHAAVVPGVALIDWAIKYARDLFSINLRFLRIETLKFQHVIRPDNHVQLSLQWNPIKGILMFGYESAYGVHANGRIVFSTIENSKTA